MTKIIPLLPEEAYLGNTLRERIKFMTKNNHSGFDFSKTLSYDIEQLKALKDKIKSRTYEEEDCLDD